VRRLLACALYAAHANAMNAHELGAPMHTHKLSAAIHLPRQLAFFALASFLIGVILNCGAASAQAQMTDLLPSSPPGVDCTWKTFDSSTLGLKMLVQDCASPDRQYVFRTEGNAIYVRAKAGDLARQEQKIIEVFTKPADLPIRNAIYQRFVIPVPAYQTAGCQVRNMRDLLFLEREQITLDIFPLGQYGYPSELSGKTDAYSVCGAYGFSADGSRFFSFHPDEDKTKYIFITMPDNKSLFDPLNILLYSGTQKLDAPPPAAADAKLPVVVQKKIADAPAPPANAFEWRLVEKIGAMSYFINAHSIVDASGHVSTQVLVDSGPRTAGKDLAGLPDGAASKIENMTVDCKTRHYKTESADLYRDNMGKGEIVRHFDQRAGWIFVPGYYVKVFDQLCQPAPSQDIAPPAPTLER
jgi:hypothetical protein